MRKNKRVKLEKNLEWLLEEYKVGDGLGAKSFTNLYSCINYTFLFFAASMVAFGLINGERGNLISLVFFIYILPICSYLFGLFYAYNSVVLSRHSIFMIVIERDIIDVMKNLKTYKSFHAWNIFSKKTPGGFMKAYGSMLVFYFALSFASNLFGFYFSDYSLILSTNSLILFVGILPMLFCFIYLIFLAEMMRYLIKYKRIYSGLIKEIKLDYEDVFSKRIKETSVCEGWSRKYWCFHSHGIMKGQGN